MPVVRFGRPFLVTLLGALGMLLALGTSPVGAEATRDRFQVTEPISMEVINDCGENVLITGEQFISFVGVVDATGGRHGTLLTQLRHLTAVGVESGTRYQVVDLQHAGGYADSETDFAPFGSTEVGSFLLVSKGGGPNLLTHGTLHTQVNANGELTADVAFSHAECVG
jgi:hypothetical protein